MIGAGVQTDLMTCRNALGQYKRIKLMLFVSPFLDTISFHGKHLLVPKRSWRFQHQATCSGPES